MTTSATYRRQAWKVTGVRTSQMQVTPALTLELSEDLDPIWVARCLVCQKWQRASTEKDEAVKQLWSHFKNQHKNEQGRLDGMV